MTDDRDELFGDGGEAAKDEAPRSILTADEIAAAKRLAHERVEKALKEAETERLIAEEMERLRREEGKRTGKVDLDENVTFIVDCAEFAAKLSVNGQDYWHGFPYTVPRHVYDSLRDTMFRGHVHQNALDGKDMATFYRSKAQPVLSGGEKAA